MESNTGPDLTTARAAIERLMDDTCIVWRDPEGLRDAVLDETTGRMVQATNEPVQVYNGPCKSKLRGEGADESQYEIGYPITGAPPAEGDVIEMTSSRRDPKLVTLRLQVFEVVRGTFQIQNKVYARTSTRLAF